MPGRIWQHECDGWYIYSNISNGTKAEDLKRISDHYHLGLKIEEGKPEKKLVNYLEVSEILSIFAPSEGGSDCLD